jgi:PPOX class probable F420-dependent enzyme
MTTDDASLAEIFGTHGRGVLATIKRDGRPQLSTVAYAYDADARVLSVSVTDTRAKTRNLRRDPRASMHVTSANPYSYAVAEGAAELTAVSGDPQDATADALVELYRAVNGEHPDWDEFRTAMVADKRLVLRLHVRRFYGLAA